MEVQVQSYGAPGPAYSPYNTQGCRKCAIRYVYTRQVVLGQHKESHQTTEAIVDTQESSPALAKFGAGGTKAGGRQEGAEREREPLDWLARGGGWSVDLALVLDPNSCAQASQPYTDFSEPPYGQLGLTPG